jgi:PKD repeat protein
MIDWGDGTVTTGVNNTHIYTNSGTYTIRVIAQYHLLSDPMNCCIKSTTKTVTFRSTSTGGGIGSPTNSGGAKSGLIQKSSNAFPNPIRKGERLTLSLSNGKTGNISIHSITGNKVMDIVNPTDSKTIKLTIPLSLKTGMYLVQFENKEIEPIKFMVD